MAVFSGALSGELKAVELTSEVSKGSQPQKEEADDGLVTVVGGLNKRLAIFAVSKGSAIFFFSARNRLLRAWS